MSMYRRVAKSQVNRCVSCEALGFRAPWTRILFIFVVFSNQTGAGRLVSTVFLFSKEFIVPKPWTREPRGHSDWKKIANMNKIRVHGWLKKTSWASRCR